MTLIATPQRSAEAGRQHLAVAQLLDLDGHENRGIDHAAFDFGQPAFAGRLEAEEHAAFRKRPALIDSKFGEGHALCSDEPNILARSNIRIARTDICGGFSHNPNMAEAKAPGDWYLQEWFAALGLIQRDLVTKLDYPTATANALWHGVQRYRRDHIQDVSALLNIRPYELLMPPEEAFAMRRLKAAIAEVTRPEPSDPVESAAVLPPARGRTGTAG